MTLKKLKTIGIIITFSMCFITHYLYSWYPNPLFSILFPVNESIFEHMKMISSTILIWQIIEHLLIKKYNLKANNYLLTSFILSILSIIVYLVIYMPIYNLMGENFIINIIVLFISIYFANNIGYLLLKSKKIKHQKLIGYLGIILLYITFVFLTYDPPKTKLFIDKRNNTYGIKT